VCAVYIYGKVFGTIVKLNCMTTNYVLAALVTQLVETVMFKISQQLSLLHVYACVWLVSLYHANYSKCSLCYECGMYSYTP